MEKELIFIGSVNKALRAKEILRSFGYTVYIERGNELGSGCGYGIIVSDCSKEKAYALLREKGVIIDIS